MGDLVRSDAFTGIGKVVGRTEAGLCEIGFFESPCAIESRIILVRESVLQPVLLLDESIVYCKDQSSGLWRRGRYGGPRPEGKHLVIFRSEDADVSVVTLAEIYCLNLASNEFLDPVAFLAMRSNDAPYFAPRRQAFLNAYLAQRAACRSISAIPSSNVELEPHQISVVRRVLQDKYPKYLLADEVGLGKTIEASLIVREHVMDRQKEARVLILVPQSLVSQWRDELSLRFHLGDLLEGAQQDNALIRIRAFDQDGFEPDEAWNPTMLVIDEAHQFAHFGWSAVSAQRALFVSIASACKTAEIVLLLSGTPLNGNERNFLAMLHCLNPDAYELSEAGVARFSSQVKQREWLGGLHSALTADNSNAALESIAGELKEKFPEDLRLGHLIDALLPLVDFFAEEAGETRSQAIDQLRVYISEHYRLHQRLLRNRREAKHLQYLFPGLDGLRRKYFSSEARVAPLEALLEAYRSEAFHAPSLYASMTVDRYLQWIDDLLDAPFLVGQRARNAIEGDAREIGQAELEILEDLVEQSLREQGAKDQALVDGLAEWFEQNPSGKAVVFCGSSAVADHVFKVLDANYDAAVERYKPSQLLQFLQPMSSIKLLVCDQHGEDGLNLHGGRRLAVHYSIPRNFSRIEQRLGRLNRYSANLRGVRPVESLALLPENVGVIRHWVDLLDVNLELFERTAASLQYLLEEKFEATWRNAQTLGDQALLASQLEFSEESGLLHRERQRIRVQEELLALDPDVAGATEFADEISTAEASAAEQGEQMSDWITNVLRFKVEGKLDEQFRLCFRLPSDENGSGRTLVDAGTFVASCITGIDRQSGNPPKTSMMSFSRQNILGDADAYPFRYGQPFLDSVYRLLATDSRGATSAFLRVYERGAMTAPRAYFRLNWLLSFSAPGDTRVQQRRGDEFFRPAVISHWLGEDGAIVTDEGKLRALEFPYKTENRGFTDLNMRHNLWDELDPILPATQWQKLVTEVAASSRILVLGLPEFAGVIAHSPSLQLMSMHAVIVCSKNLLETA
ncbi:protein DpdE [Paraburkholderia diazotrophica]|nr:protein DpdE [Paraburkholderia diazotrophica]